MLIGDYIILVESDSGSVIGSEIRTSTTGRPSVGEEIALNDKVYTVERVRHEDDPESPSGRTYTIAKVYVRIVEGARPVRRRPKPPQDGSRIPPFVAPAGPSDTPVESAYLPAPLVAVLVACGYRALASEYRARRRITARLMRDGHGWFVDEPPAHCWQESRRAKRYFVEAATMMQERELSPVILSSGGVAQACSRVESLRALRPALRLV
jgi:hypothetical protein